MSDHLVYSHALMYKPHEYFDLDLMFPLPHFYSLIELTGILTILSRNEICIYTSSTVNNYKIIAKDMKRLDLIVAHEHVREVNDILHRYKVGGMTFYDIRGRGRSKYEPVDVGRGIRRYVPEFGSWTKVEILVADSQAKKIIDDILEVISTGSASDGKIFVYEVAEAYDIGTKETGDNAI